MGSVAAERSFREYREYEDRRCIYEKLGSQRVSASMNELGQRTIPR